MSMDLSGYDEHELEKMSVIADEYADDIIAGADKRAFLMEHAKVILDDKAIESLAQL
jgi:adapter protein MecA 1/2